MQAASKLNEKKRHTDNLGSTYNPPNLKRRILREKFIEIRDELFPENWSADIDNWSRKRYCPICKSSLPVAYNAFQVHSNDFHDDWADIVKPWIKWKGLRTTKKLLHK